jgi:hypothetical protein
MAPSAALTTARSISLAKDRTKQELGKEKKRKTNPILLLGPQMKVPSKKKEKKEKSWMKEQTRL